ncbi:MAG TPA: Ig-like domain-containing protein [Candidatus Onthovivens sp.]|nr:Ig-like domain-containing protein [Candidatus Onthovivens sp.]
MSKRKFKGIILATSLLAFSAIAITGCTPPEVVVPPTPEQDAVLDVTSVEIENAEDLKLDWREGETDRDIKLKFDKPVNVTQALQNGSLKIETKNGNVGVFGKYLKALKKGDDTITVTAKLKDNKTVQTSLDLTVLESFVEPTPIATTVAEVLETPFDEKETPQKIYTIKGKITGYRPGKEGFEAYGNFMMADLVDATKVITVYGATMDQSTLVFEKTGFWKFSNPQDFLTDKNSSKIVIGDVVEMKVIRADYEGAPQVKGAILSINDQEVLPSVSQILAMEADDTKLIKVVGKISGYQAGKSDFSKYGNFMLQDLDDPKKEILVYGATYKEDALVLGEDGKYTFANPKVFLDEIAEKPLVVGDVIEMNGFRFDYTDGTPEYNGVITKIREVEAAPATGVEINGARTEVQVEKTLALTAKVLPEDAKQSVSWKSLNEDIATVDSKGVVTGVKEGTAEIVATAENSTISSKYSVTVKALALDKVSDIRKGFDKGDTGILEGIVAEISKKAVVLFDGADYILVHINAAHEHKVGDFVRVKGTISEYHKLAQIASPEFSAATGTKPTWSAPTAEILDSAAWDAYKVETSGIKFVGVEAKVIAAGKYFNFQVGDSAVVGALSNAAGDDNFTVADNLDKVYDITGYIVGFGSGPDRLDFVVSSVTAK